MKKFIIILMLSIFLLPIVVLAHHGRTDSYGCHTCRTNCVKWGLSTGEYHCHQAKTLSQPVEPVKSHKSDTGVGYTTPAPEYSVPKVGVKEVKKIITPKIEIKIAPALDANNNNDKEKTLVNAVEKMPKTTESEKISLFKRIFVLIFGN